MSSQVSVTQRRSSIGGSGNMYTSSGFVTEVKRTHFGDFALGSQGTPVSIDRMDVESMSLYPTIGPTRSLVFLSTGVPGTSVRPAHGVTILSQRARASRSSEGRISASA